MVTLAFSCILKISGGDRKNNHHDIEKNKQNLGYSGQKNREKDRLHGISSPWFTRMNTRHQSYNELRSFILI